MFRNIYKKILIIIGSVLFIVPIYADDPTVGLILNDDSKSFYGYTLFTPKKTNTTYLINNDGNLIHKWENDYQHTATAYILENGNLLRSTRLPDSTSGGGFQVRDWENNLIWEFTHGPQHHDIEPMPNGNVLLITNHTIYDTTTIALDAGADTSLHIGDVKSLTILEIANNNGTGEIVWKWRAWDHLIQDFDSLKPNYGVVSEHPELINLNYVQNINNNWIHPNSIDYNEEFNQIMISARSYNELWIIDHSTTTEEAATHAGGNNGKGGDLLYRWGNPAAYDMGDTDDQFLYGQHDARWIEEGLPGEGNITAFNNGLGRPDGAYSSIIEIAPPIDNVGNYAITTGSPFDPNSLTWSYIADEPTDMYSSKFSGAHRLPNGNTLICNGVGGELIEVTSAGEIVWKYINPESTDGILTQGDVPNKNDVFRAHKYSMDFIVSLGVDTTSQGPIEMYNVAVEDENNINLTFRLNQNHPNPFNPTTNIEFELGESSYVTLTIYDIVGREIRKLVSKQMDAGIQSISWDSLNENGIPVGSGIYFYSIVAGQEKMTKKMMLLR